MPHSNFSRILVRESLENQFLQFAIEKRVSLQDSL